jgi:hypothetical protein
MYLVMLSLVIFMTAEGTVEDEELYEEEMLSAWHLSSHGTL